MKYCVLCGSPSDAFNEKKAQHMHLRDFHRIAVDDNDRLHIWVKMEPFEDRSDGT